MDLFEQTARERKSPVNILHGTDWWTDCDDVAALRLLLNAHRSGAVRLLAIGINSVMEYSAPSVSAFCEYSGVSVPIGVDKSAVRDGGKCRYQKLLSGFPHPVGSNSDCPDAWRLYRKVLSELDGKADIIDVGFPQIIMELLKSPPDGSSPLTGTQLVREKVGRIWLMAGKWDVPDGLEYNLSAYPVCAEAGDYICRNCPVPITFIGYEVGQDVITGADVPGNDPLKQAFTAHGSASGRSSWDPLTALTAILQDESAAGFETVRGFARVDPKTGKNNFTPDPLGPHAYVKRLHPAEWYAGRINELL
ncbi:MAG: hypothetical protein K6C36_09530 [Clostridia bacterium]|nr:hypothetical protein [Clostridia bacterium]